MLYINNKEKLERIKINKDDIYAVMDFDQTITTGDSQNSWSVLMKSKYIHPEHSKKHVDLFYIHRDAETNTKLDINERRKVMIKWYTEILKLFDNYKEDAGEEIVKRVIKESNMRFRDGMKEFFEFLYKKNIPLIIISAGITNTIEEFLKQKNAYFDNIYVVSNYIEFGNAQKSIVGVSPLNKGLVRLPKKVEERIKNKEHILLFGDVIADIDMVKKEDLYKTITIGFIDNHIEERIKAYNKCFDIVLTHDGSVERIREVLKI